MGYPGSASEDAATREGMFLKKKEMFAEPVGQSCFAILIGWRVWYGGVDIHTDELN